MFKNLKIRVLVLLFLLGGVQLAEAANTRANNDLVDLDPIIINNSTVTLSARGDDLSLSIPPNLKQLFHPCFNNLLPA